MFFRLVCILELFIDLVRSFAHYQDSRIFLLLTSISSLNEINTGNVLMHS